jgi:hypothetical protein
MSAHQSASRRSRRSRMSQATSVALRPVAKACARKPIASTPEAKLVHALGFEQCTSAYLREVGADPQQIEAHRQYLHQVLHDPAITIALFENTQYITRRSGQRP